jgi:hypothetical protein
MSQITIAIVMLGEKKGEGSLYYCTAQSSTVQIRTGLAVFFGRQLFFLRVVICWTRIWWDVMR